MGRVWRVARSRSMGESAPGLFPRLPSEEHRELPSPFTSPDPSDKTRSSYPVRDRAYLLRNPSFTRWSVTLRTLCYEMLRFVQNSPRPIKSSSESVISVPHFRQALSRAGPL